MSEKLLLPLNIQENGTDEPICRAGTERETDVENRHVATGWRGTVGQIERVAWTYMHHHM